MSKFGSDNGAGNGGNGFGPKPTGQPSREATPNGFRLDSTQSSWLMDRLNALNEEDKLAMKAAAAEPLPRDADRAPVGPQGVPQGSPDGAPQGGQPDPRHFHPGQPQAPAPHAPMGERGADPQRGQPPRQGDGFGRPQQLRQQPPQDGAPRHYDGRPGDGHGHMPAQDLNRQQQDMSRQQADQQRGGFDRALPGQMPQDETADFAERDYSEANYAESEYAESNHPENEYADGDYEPEGFDEGDDGYRLSDDPDENARLLREKIESLEKQIAEISQLNDDKRNQYREELVYRGVQLGKLKEQAELDQNAERKSYYRGTEVPPRPEQPPVEETAEFDEAGAEEGQYFDEQSAHHGGEIETREPDGHGGDETVYDLTPDQVAEADFDYLREQLEPHLDRHEPLEQAAPHRPDYDYAAQHPAGYEHGQHVGGVPGAPYQQDSHQGGEWQGEERQVGDWRGQPHDPSLVHGADASFLGGQEAYYRGNAQEEQNPALPQFLSSPPPSKLMRPKFVSVVGTMVAVLVIGGVGYSFVGQGVSDVVKSDFASLSGDKQTEKLSEIVPRRDLEVVAPPPPVEERVVAALSPAQFAAAFQVESLIGVAGQEIILPVSLPDLGGYPAAFVVLRNLPQWAGVPNGRLVSGNWIVAAGAAKNLAVKIPDDQPGTFKFEADLVFKPGETPVTRTVNAVIAPVTQAATPEEKAPAVVANAPVVEQPEQIKTPEATASRGPLIIDQALEEKWLERGTRLLRAGDVSAARLAFSHLAEQGSGRGALAMGMTFDPNQPSSRVVAGIEPDVKRARFWYQRALALGNESAREPLRILGPGE